MKQFRPGEREQSRLGKMWYRMALTLVTAAAFAAVLLPVAAKALSGAASPLSPENLSHITRASAFAAYVLIWLSMLAGLSITSKVGRKRPGMSMRFGLHRFMSLLGLGFASLHALSLLGPGYMSYSPVQLLVPFMVGEYKTQWLGLGQVALYSLAVIAFSFYFRDRLGVRSWRLVHSLSFALFLMALIHGLQSGSDSGTWWATTLYWVSAASVVLGSLYRVLASRVGRPKREVASTGLIITGGRAQAERSQAALQTRGLVVGNRMKAVPERVLIRG